MPVIGWTASTLERPARFHDFLFDGSLSLPAGAPERGERSEAGNVFTSGSGRTNANSTNEVNVADQKIPSRALDGVRILAFEQVLSGPFATCLLADMGAQVIKIERPGVGDVIRSWDSVVRGLSSGYVWLNRNKRSMTIDVKKEMIARHQLGGR